MIEAVVDFRRAAPVSASLQEVWALLANVPLSASHFPDVVSLVEEGGVTTWTLKPMGPSKVSVQTIYGCRYTLDEARCRVEWEALPAIGNARVSGHWTGSASGPGSRIEIANRFALDVPVPRLVASVARPVVEREANRLLEGYFANIVATLSGGDGRQRRA